MNIRRVEPLWPYGPESSRKPTQLEVLVDLDDDTRWVSTFFDTHEYNRGVKGFKGLGPDQPWRHGPRLVIVRELTAATIREAAEGVMAQGHFIEAFEKVGEVPPEERAEA